MRHLLNAIFVAVPLSFFSIGCGDAAPADETVAVAGEEAAVKAEQPNNFRELKTDEGASQGLYAGGHPSKGNMAFLANLGVHTDLSLQTAEELAFWDHEIDVGAFFHFESPEHKHASDKGLAYIRKSWLASQVKDMGYVDDVLAIMADRTKRPLYLHCEYGADRTGAVIAMHRVVNEGWDGAKAFHEWRANTGRCGKYRAPEDTFNAKLKEMFAKTGDRRYDFAIKTAPDCSAQ
jgi:hypothetical protein